MSIALVPSQQEGLGHAIKVDQLELNIPICVQQQLTSREKHIDLQLVRWKMEKSPWERIFATRKSFLLSKTAH